MFDTYCFYRFNDKKNKTILTKGIKQRLFFKQFEAFSFKLSRSYQCFRELFLNLKIIILYQCQTTNAAKVCSMYTILKEISFFSYWKLTQVCPIFISPVKTELLITRTENESVINVFNHLRQYIHYTKIVWKNKIQSVDSEFWCDMSNSHSNLIPGKQMIMFLLWVAFILHYSNRINIIWARCGSKSF